MKDLANTAENACPSATRADAQSVHVLPHLFFGGTCEQALDYYRQSLGAEVLCLMRYSDSPDPTDSSQCPPESPDKIMHGEFRLGASVLFAADCPSQYATQTSNVTLTLNAPTKQDAQRFFAALSEGGQVQMPLGETFFAKQFGMCVDRFGISWMIITPKQEG